MDVCSWPPWPTVLAESQQKSVTLGDQCVLTLPCGVLYNEISYALYRVGMGRKQFYFSVFVLFKCVSYVEEAAGTLSNMAVWLAALRQQSLSKQAWTMLPVSWP